MAAVTVTPPAEPSFIVELTADEYALVTAALVNTRGDGPFGYGLFKSFIDHISPGSETWTHYSRWLDAIRPPR